jgi:hypothetical protein
MHFMKPKFIPSALKHEGISGNTLRQTHYRRLEKDKCCEGVFAACLRTDDTGQRSICNLVKQPLIFESLIKHCQEFIRRRMTTEIGPPVAADAAEVMIAKLEKCKCYLTCELSRSALALDPAIPNTSTEVEATKVLIRETLVREYGMTVQHAPTQSQRGFLAAARAARAHFISWL